MGQSLRAMWVAQPDGEGYVGFHEPAEGAREGRNARGNRSWRKVYRAELRAAARRLRRAGILPRAAAIALAALASPALAAGPTTSFSVSGQVQTPQSFNLKALQALPATTQSVTYISGSGTFTGTFTGVPLWTLLNDVTGIKTNASIKNDILRQVVMVTGSDGYQVVYSMGELNPNFGGSVNVPLMAYASNGALITTDGFARTTAPGDARGGRYVSNVASVEVLHIPYLTGTYAGGVATSFSLTGLVDKPATYTLSNITSLPSTSITVSGNTYTGVTLWSLLTTAGVTTNPQVKNNILRDYVVVTGSDGYQTVVALGEISPSFGNQQDLIAYALNGGAPGTSLGANGYFRLIVPTDVRQGRWVSNVIGIEVFDAAIWMASAGELLDLTGLPITSEGLRLQGGTLTSTGGPGTLTAATYLLQGGLIDTSASLGLTGAVTQSAGVTLLKGKIGTPDVTITGGTLQLGDNNRLSSATTLKMTGGAFNLAGFAQTLATLNGTGSILLSSNQSSGKLTVGSGNFGGVIANGGSQPGSLVVAGPGVLTLSGANTFTGPTQVTGGVLNLANGLLPGSVSVGSGAALTGTGKVGATTVAGTLSPGSGTAIGTIGVSGLLAFSPTSTYLVGVSNQGASSVNVTGSASLAGNVTVAPISSTSYKIGSSYALVSATNGVSGRFSEFDVQGSFGKAIVPELVYGAYGVLLYLAPNTISSQLTTPVSANQARAAAGVDAVLLTAQAPQGFVDLFNVPSTSLPIALSSLSGELGTSVETTTVQAGQNFLRILADPNEGHGGLNAAAVGYAPGAAPLAYAPGELPSAKFSPKNVALPPPPAPLWSVWATAFGSSSKFAGDTGTGSSNVTTQIGGIAAGAAYRPSPDLVLGFALAGGGGTTSLSNGLGSANNDVFQAGIYGSKQFGALYVSAAAAYTHTWSDLTRTIYGTGTYETLTSSPTANAFGGRLEGGYRFALGSLGITPYAAVDAQSYQTGSYAETSSLGTPTFGLAYRSKTAGAFRSELGLRFDGTTVVADTTTIKGFARVAWVAQTSRAPSLNATFEALPVGAFSVEGAGAPPNAALLALGVEARFANNVKLVASAEAEFAGAGQSTLFGKVTAKYEW